MSSASAVMRRVSGGNVIGPANFLSGMPGSVRPYEIKRISPSSRVTVGFPLQPTWDSDRAVREGLKICATLATCFGKVAEKCASVPWFEWEAKKSGTPKRLDIVPWIEWPRQDGQTSRMDLIEEAHLHGMLSGNALFGTLWEGGQRRIRPRELQAENPHGCRPIPDRLKYISSYEWDDVSLFGPNKWDARDIVHVIYRRDPAVKYWGWSIVEALAATIDADVEARRLNLRRFRRGGNPGTIVIDKKITDDEKRLETEENLNRSAQRRYGAFMVLGGSMEVAEQKALTSRQLGLLEAMAFHRDEIAVACDFLPAMFDPRAATYDNVDLAIRHEWRIAVLRNKRFADSFTKKFVRKEDRGRRWFAPWYGEVEELQDLRQKIDQTADLVQKCQVAVNDAIVTTGLPVRKQPGGDVALVNAGMIPATDASAPLTDS